MQKQLEEFLGYLENEKRYSINTIIAYILGN